MNMGMSMRKTITILLALLAAFWTNPASAVGTIALSLSQQLDNNGVPLGGCLLYTIQAGTTSTPQNAYQDTGLTIPLPNPMTCDAYGRLPQFFLADGQIKVRLTDKNGNQILVQDNILVIGPSSGGGGGGSVDPTTILATGDFKMEYGSGPISGFVRCNGRTIGSATSGASERANADTTALFSFLWNADPNLAVSSGRGASAAADFAANKNITLPDCRGRALAGLDDMGNSAAGRLTSAIFGSTPTTLGAGGGNQSITLATANLPPYTPSGTVTTTFPATIGGEPPYFITPGGCCVGFGGSSSGASDFSLANVNIPSTWSGAAQGGTSTPLATVSPLILTTIYIKL